jgi:hypothetical protein
MNSVHQTKQLVHLQLPPQFIQPHILMQRQFIDHVMDYVLIGVVWLFGVAKF